MSNSVMLIGRPSTNVAEDNTFAIVVTERVKDNETKEWVTETQRFKCVCSEEVVKRAKEYILKGLRVALDGKLKAMPDGSVVIVVRDFFMIERPA